MNNISIKITLIITLILNNTVQGYALTPFATGVSFASLIQPGYVHVINLKTGKKETVSRKSFLGRIKTTEFNNILTTERLNSKGTLLLGKTTYGHSYIACSFLHHANGLVQYKLENGIVTNIVLLSKTNTPLEEYKLAIVKDASGSPIDSFLFQIKLPKRIRSLISEGKLSSIEHLFIDDNNILKFSKTEIYDFTRKGNFAGKEITVCWTKHKPAVSHFLINIEKETLRIPAEELLTEAVVRPRGKIEIDLVSPVPEIPPEELQEVIETLYAAIEQLPPEKRPLAKSVLSNMPQFKEKEGLTVIDQLAEKMEIDKAEIVEILTLLIKTDAFQKIAKDYPPQQILSLYQEPKIKRRFDVPPLPVLKKGFVYIRYLDTGDLKVITKEELVRLCKQRKLDNVEVIYDRLNEEGELLHSTNKGKRGDKICRFLEYPNRKVRYIIRKGKPDRSTIVILNNKGLPLQGPNDRYAIDPKTGEIRCHLPKIISNQLLRLLDDVIIYDKLNRFGGLNLGLRKSGSSKKICQFTNYPFKRLRYHHIHNGKVDRTTIMLLKKDGTPLIDKNLKYIADPKTNKIRCHLPVLIYEELWKELGKLDDVVVYGRLTKKGTLNFRSGKGKKRIILTYGQHPGKRIKFHLRRSKLDVSSLILLNEDGTTLEDTWTRYAVDPKTGKIKCHLPKMLRKRLRKQLDNLIIYDRLYKEGSLPLKEKAKTSFTKHPYRRIKYSFKEGEVDRTTILLLNEDGTILEDENTAYAVDSETGEIRCHLPPVVYVNLRRQLDNFIIYDKLSPKGLLNMGSKPVVVYRLHPGRRVKYCFKNGYIVKSSIVLLDDSGLPLDDGKTMYAVDLKTGSIKCHLPGSFGKAWAKALGRVEIMNKRLGGDGRLHFIGKKVYNNAEHKKGRVRCIIYKNKVVIVTLLDENHAILSQEILDKELALEALSKKGIIEHIKGPGNCRIISYSSFLQRLFADYMRLKEEKTKPQVLRTTLIERLYDLLDINAYFFLGEHLKIHTQFELKTKIFLLWKDIIHITEDELQKRLMELTQLFAKFASSTIGDEPKDTSQLPATLCREIREYQNKMVEEGMKHNPVLHKSRPRKHRLTPHFQDLDSAT